MNNRPAPSPRGMFGKLAAAVDYTKPIEAWGVFGGVWLPATVVELLPDGAGIR